MNTLNKYNLLKTGIVALGGVLAFSHTASAKNKNSKPNIVFILADDMGYGDVSCLNKDCDISTPNLDRMAKQGVTFTDAHTSSAVSTPTRYGLLTGRYNWRSRLKSGVLWGADDALIEEGRPTIASFLKDAGYHTAIIGKWHLGLNWQRFSGTGYDIDYSKPVDRSPNTNGFDYSYIIPSSLDIPPYVYVENGKVTQVPTDSIEATHGLGFWRKGIISKDFKHEEVLPNFTHRAVNYIKEASKKKQPFFLYLALNSPHTPIVPTKEFKGISNTNDYGDYVMMSDWAVGEVLKALKEAGCDENTLVVFTADNGCSPGANLRELQEKGHNPSYIWRGGKADIYEGGHRVPYFAKWPHHIPEGITSPEILCTTDFFATCADILNQSLTENEAEDSFSMLPAMQGEEYQSPIREALVHHSIEGEFAIRQGDWKLVEGPGSGGWTYPRPNQCKGLPKYQLFNLKEDPSEKVNVAASHQEIVEKLEKLLTQYKEKGHTRY